MGYQAFISLGLLCDERRGVSAGVIYMKLFIYNIPLRFSRSGLELIASKWAHSLIELDLAWANVQQPIDNALRALAEKGSESPLA